MTFYNQSYSSKGTNVPLYYVKMLHYSGRKDFSNKIKLYIYNIIWSSYAHQYKICPLFIPLQSADIRVYRSSARRVGKLHRGSVCVCVRLVRGDGGS